MDKPRRKNAIDSIIFSTQELICNITALNYFNISSNHCMVRAKIKVEQGQSQHNVETDSQIKLANSISNFNSSD